MVFITVDFFTTVDRTKIQSFKWRFITFSWFLAVIKYIVTNSKKETLFQDTTQCSTGFASPEVQEQTIWWLAFLFKAIQSV